MTFFAPQQPGTPALMGGIPPQLLQMIMQQAQMQGGRSLPAGATQLPQTPVNIPQQGLMPGQQPLAGPGPSSQMNPLASILGNAGGAMSPQGGFQDGSGNNMSGLMQIINAMKSQQQVNGTQSDASGPGGLNIMAIIKAMHGG